MESIEDCVVKRIHEHSEYEEPVDECIKNRVRRSGLYWRHFYRGLERKVARVSMLSPFEQVLKTEEILPLGRLEKVEEPLFRRIGEFEKAQEQTSGPSTFSGGSFCGNTNGSALWRWSLER